LRLEASANIANKECAPCLRIKAHRAVDIFRLLGNTI